MAGVFGYMPMTVGYYDANDIFQIRVLSLRKLHENRQHHTRKWYAYTPSGWSAIRESHCRLLNEVSESNPVFVLYDGQNMLHCTGDTRILLRQEQAPPENLSLEIEHCVPCFLRNTLARYIADYCQSDLTVKDLWNDASLVTEEKTDPTVRKVTLSDCQPVRLSAPSLVARTNDDQLKSVRNLRSKKVLGSVLCDGDQGCAERLLNNDVRANKARWKRLRRAFRDMDPGGGGGPMSWGLYKFRDMGTEQDLAEAHFISLMAHKIGFDQHSFLPTNWMEPWLDLGCTPELHSYYQNLDAPVNRIRRPWSYQAEHYTYAGDAQRSVRLRIGCGESTYSNDNGVTEFGDRMWFQEFTPLYFYTLTTDNGTWTAGLGNFVIVSG